MSCLTHILGTKMLLFGVCFILYFLKLSAGIGYCIVLYGIVLYCVVLCYVMLYTVCGHGVATGTLNALMARNYPGFEMTIRDS